MNNKKEKQEDPNDWRHYICVAHDELISLRGVINKFNLTHIFDNKLNEFIPIINYNIDNTLEELHVVGFLRCYPFGKDWISYILTRFVRAGDEQKIFHTIMAKQVTE